LISSKAQDLLEPGLPERRGFRDAGLLDTPSG